MENYNALPYKICEKFGWPEPEGGLETLVSDIDGVNKIVFNRSNSKVEFIAEIGEITLVLNASFEFLLWNTVSFVHEAFNTRDIFVHGKRVDTSVFTTNYNDLIKDLCGA